MGGGLGQAAAGGEGEMAVRLIAGGINRYEGYSYDSKPVVGAAIDGSGATVTARDLPAGCIFDELDTGYRYQFTGERWEREESPVVRALEGIARRQDVTNRVLEQMRDGMTLGRLMPEVE